MLTPTCSKCNRVIPSEDINVANDVAYCRGCNLSYKLSALINGTELDSWVNLNIPPAGAWYRQTGMETVIGGTHRSVGMAIGALAISLFWNGIMSVFMLIAVAGTLHILHITPPHWLPAPKMNGGDMGIGITIFLWLFLTPFIVIGMIMIWTFLSSLGGKTEVRFQNSSGVVFTGIGALGYRRRFDMQTVKEVRIQDNPSNDGQQKTCIAIEMREGRLIKFGSMLRADRRKFVAAAVRQTLLH